MNRKFLAIATLAAGVAFMGGAVLAAPDDHGTAPAAPSATHGDRAPQSQGQSGHSHGGNAAGSHGNGAHHMHGMGGGMEMNHGMTMGQGMNMGMRGGNASGAMMGPLHGGTATPAERQDLHTLFFNHAAIKRTVTNLPNGIRTVTESDDPAVAKTIKEHVAGMLKRVAEKRDPGMPIESPSLRAIFANYDKITTQVEQTEKGAIVTQTSDDATAVAVLQKHAGEVSDFADRGMRAAFEALARNGAMPAGAMGMMGKMGMMGRTAMHGDRPAGTPAPVAPPADHTH